MNERIKELAEQAKLNPVLLLQQWGTIDALTDSEQESLERIEKFAELIVRECCDIFVELRTRPADLAVKDVKKHFGVE